MTTLYTIGHSTREPGELEATLTAHRIQLLADVRSMPGSNRYPHFNREVLEESVPQAGIAYIHLPVLGGRRKNQDADPAINAGWKNKSFRNYADYTLTDTYDDGIALLLTLAEQYRVAFMCSEAVPWRCHRSIISTTLTARSHTVLHIMDAEHEPQPHVLDQWGPTPHVEEGRVTYPEVGG